MFEYPVVLVVSDGKIEPNSIIKDICNKECENIVLFRESDTAGVLHKMTTKYYETTVLLMPVELNLTNLTSEILQNTEALILYLDFRNAKSFERLSEYTDFLTKNKIGLGILLCEKLSESPNDGVTYEDVRKKCCFPIDIIELETNDENEPNSGFLEVRNVLSCYIWSTLKTVSEKNLSVSQLQKKVESVGFSKHTSEEKLDVFEKLVFQVQTFKEETSCWERADILSYAEKLAEQFSQIMLESDDERMENEAK